MIETFLLPSWIPMILCLLSSLLILTSKHHTRNVRFIHFIGRFYLFIVYGLATVAEFKFSAPVIQALARFGLILLMLEEVVVWFIEIRWPTIRRS